MRHCAIVGEKPNERRESMIIIVDLSVFPYSKILLYKCTLYGVNVDLSYGVSRYCMVFVLAT